MPANTDRPESTERTTTNETRRLRGYDATFGTDPDEIYVELRLGRPAYVRLAEGDYLQEGDAFHRERLDEGPPSLDTWAVVHVGPDEVVGRHVETGEEAVWDRDAVETGLAVGEYSTNLTDFERISVYQTGTWSAYEPDAPDAGPRYTDRPYVAVVAYGDNGRKYGRRYRFVSPETNELALWTADEPADGFRAEVADRLDRRVREALEADGYTVVEPA